MTSTAETDLQTKMKAASEALDAWTREIVQWHFNPETGCPFWLDYAKQARLGSAQRNQSYDDLARFGFFQDEWLRGGPVRRWVPKAYADRPVYIFETGGSTGVPKSRISIEDFRIDYEAFSETLPDEFFPKGADWLMLGPTGPRRLRLAVEHLAQHRGGICFMRRPRSALGDQADQEGPERDGREIQAARNRSGADAAARRTTTFAVCSPRRSCSRRSCERVSLKKSGHHRSLLRRHGDDAAVSSLRGGGVAGRRLLRADLRQHADGSGGAQAARGRKTTTRSFIIRRRRAR